MNAMEFYLRSVDAQTWHECEAEGVDPNAALTELPSPAPEAADALPEAIDLCEEDLEPQIEALAAEVEMSCDIRDLIEEGG